jgi:hypothetical protein
MYPSETSNCPNKYEYKPIPGWLGAWRLPRCISRRAPKIDWFFESRESSKHWGFARRSLTPIHVRGGCRSRILCVALRTVDVVNMQKQPTNP